MGCPLLFARFAFELQHVLFAFLAAEIENFRVLLDIYHSCPPLNHVSAKTAFCHRVTFCFASGSALQSLFLSALRCLLCAQAL